MNCPGCDGFLPDRKYLCRGCWFRLPPLSRRALSRHDDRARDRLFTLYRVLLDGVPLEQVIIT